MVPRAAQVHGQPSDEQSGTHRRTGIDYNSLNAAEIAQGLRVNYDAIAGRPNQIEYQVDPGSTQREVQTDRGFARDSSTLGAQATDADYTNTGYDKGHLAQREAFKGDGHVERAADLMTNVVPMTVALNRGEGSPWRAAEAETIRWADQYGGVQVKVTPIYDANPPKLPSGIPIPKAIHRKVVAADGQVLQDLTFLNR